MRTHDRLTQSAPMIWSSSTFITHNCSGHVQVDAVTAISNQRLPCKKSFTFLYIECFSKASFSVINDPEHKRELPFQKYPYTCVHGLYEWICSFITFVCGFESEEEIIEVPKSHLNCGDGRHVNRKF